MRRFRQFIKEMFYADRIVKQHHKAYEKEVKKTTSVIRKANKVFANGVTIKIHKAVHNGGHK